MWNKKYPISRMEYYELDDVDRVQLDVMETLKDCGLEKDSVMNIMLSIALSIEDEDNPENSIERIVEKLTVIKTWRNEDETNN